MKFPLAALCLSAMLVAAEAPPSATTLLDEAKAKAGSGNRSVLVIFGASWCGWCKKLDAFLGSEEIRPIVERHFVPLHITVQEHGDKQALNTPGGQELFKQVGGAGGLPFFAFLDPAGGMIVNSVAPGKNGKKGENIGHPNEPEEVDWFLAMVRKAAPGMTAEESAVMERYLRAQKQ